MRNRLLLLVAVVFILLVLFVIWPIRIPTEVAHRPKLVVVIIIDQFRPDYLVRFRPYFVKRGFNLLLGGANFVNCRYDYAITATGPGHATLFTGAYPDMHGIVGNDWFDRSLGRSVNCVEDRSTQLAAPADEPDGRLGASPKNLVGSTLGDELRFASDFQSRVIAIALKDRAAILPGGHTANAAYWYKSKTGHFVSSTYYMPALPSWVAKFNDQPPAKAYCGKAWQGLPETPGVRGKTIRAFAPKSPEACPGIQFLEWLADTPFMTEIELKFALEAIKNERLGQGPTTDLLTISLSVNDFIGHKFGPYSPEVADLTLRTDRYLADFFNELDSLVGLDNVWIALSADHGASPTPRFITEHHLGMGSFEKASAGAIDKALSHAFGREKWIKSIQSNYIYLNEDAAKRRQMSLARLEAVLAERAMSLPGVRTAFTRTQLLTGMLPQSPLGRKVANSFYAPRSGDVFLVLNPYALAGAKETETSHGSPWNYDAQVPLLLWGSAFKPGEYAIPCQTIDLAPTLAVALGVNQPSVAQGQPLTPALRLP